MTEILSDEKYGCLETHTFNPLDFLDTPASCFSCCFSVG